MGLIKVGIYQLETGPKKEPVLGSQQSGDTHFPSTSGATLSQLFSSSLLAQSIDSDDIEIW